MRIFNSVKNFIGLARSTGLIFAIKYKSGCAIDGIDFTSCNTPISNNTQKYNDTHRYNESCENPLIVGCKCGNHQYKSIEPDQEYGQYYVVIECDTCDYYWEGYMGYIE